jgi:hypothetical protein
MPLKGDRMMPVLPVHVRHCRFMPKALGADFGALHMREVRGLLAPREVSIETGIPETLLARWRSQRRVLDFVKIGGRAFYRRADVDGLKRNNRIMTLSIRSREQEGEQCEQFGGVRARRTSATGLAAHFREDDATMLDQLFQRYEHVVEQPVGLSRIVATRHEASDQSPLPRDARLPLTNVAVGLREVGGVVGHSTA